MLHLHRSERADALVAGLAERSSVPARRPVHARRGRGAGSRRRALAHPAAVAPPGRGRRAATASAPTSCSRGRRDWSPTRSRPAAASSPTTTRGCRTAALVRARGHRRLGRRAVAGAPRAATWARGAVGGWWPPGTWPRCSTPTPRTGRRCCATGSRAATPTGSAVRCPTTSPGRPSCGGGSRRAVGTPSPAERLDAACAALRADPARSDLPQRLSVFGPTRLHHRAGRACWRRLAEHRDVHLWLPHPSPTLWDRVAAHVADVPRRRSDPTADVPTHPLLSSLGRDAREMQLVLATAGADAVRHPPPPGRAAGHPAGPAAARPAQRRARRPVHRSAAAPTTAATPLGSRRPQPAGARLPRPGAPGRGAPRGAAGPAGRRPDPRAARRAGDVPRHRGLRAADLGDVRARRRRRRRRHAIHPGHRLRVRLADRSLRQTNPLLATMARVARACRRPGDGIAGARPGRAAAGAPAVPLRRRRPRTPARVGRGVGYPMGARRRAPGAVPPRGPAARTPGRPGSTASCWARPWPRTTCAGWGSRCRSTTSTPATSTSPAGWPSWSTGSRQRVDSLAPRPVAGRLAGRAVAGPSTRSPTSPTPTAGSSARPGASSTRSPTTAGDGSAVTCRSPTSGRCSPTGSRAVPPGPASAPAT